MSLFRRSYRLGQAAGLVRIVEDFIVEDREVEGQTKTDGVRRLHVPFAYVESLLVRLLGAVRCLCRQKSKPKKALLFTVYWNLPLICMLFFFIVLLQCTKGHNTLTTRYLPFLASPDATSDRYLK